MLVKTGLRQVVILVCSALLLVPSTTLARAQGGNKKPSLSLKASPSVSFAPARIVVLDELKGGADDAEEFYYPTVEWEWGDGTVSTAEADCNPYEAGKSQIKRRYTVEHQFRNPGGFKISLRLKKGTKVAAVANAVVQVRAGLGPGI